MVASRTACFWAPYVTKGFTPDSGSSWLLPRLVGVARAKEMLLLGRRVDGEKAAAWGLVNECVDDEQLDAALGEVTDELADAATVSVGLAKSLVHRGLTLDLNTTNFHLRWSMADRAHQWDRALGLHLSPENIVGNAARFLDLAARLVEKRLELGGVRQHQPFQFILVCDRQQDRQD